MGSRDIGHGIYAVPILELRHLKSYNRTKRLIEICVRSHRSSPIFIVSIGDKTNPCVCHLAPSEALKKSTRTTSVSSDQPIHPPTQLPTNQTTKQTNITRLSLSIKL